ncbi:MAG TPA: S9 family peptidase [Bryobacteraceae bacterium]|nr:S9 family peptidase [Bryobacteraceae bacterium]
MRVLAVSVLSLISATGLIQAVGQVQEKQPFTAQAMMRLKRISEPSLSPDGQWVAFTVATVDVEANATQRHLYVTLASAASPRAVATEGRNSHPRFSPDSKKLAFLSTRSGASQIWLMNPDGTAAKQLTKLSTGVEEFTWSPNGNFIVAVSAVFPDCADDACNARRIDEESKSKVKARIYTGLLYRHWTEWQTPRRKHLFVVAVDGAAPRDLTPGLNYDVPPFALGGGEYSVSPDGKEVCYAANLDPDQALSTNAEIYTVPVEGGEPKKVSTSLGGDTAPQYSPDGKWIAWRMQVRAGYEADRWRLVVMNRETGSIETLTENLDRHVDSFTWHPDSKRIAFTFGDRGRQTAHLIPITGGGTRVIVQGASTVGDLQFSADGKILIYSEATGASPSEIYKASSTGGAPVALTRLNAGMLAGLDLRPLEEFTVAGAESAPVHSFLLKPPDFDPKKKYPVLFLIHGGPQGAWGESFSFRWNQQVFATAGFVVVMPNPRGSTGYGTKFTDDINGDWGGRVYDDIMAVVDHISAQPWADSDRFAAAGGSYGGYMVNWILGHSQRFKALVSHAGVYDLRSMGGETEELWFSVWENKGFPWQTPELHERFSPSSSAANFKTPTLVIHGELDFRVPYGQGLQLFTALQANTVPSKLLIYPDEGHWILKPQNSLLWYQTFLDWVGEWTAKK